MANLELVALIVRDYDLAIRFFVDALQFELVEDRPSLTNDGRPKRWVVVRPVGAQTGILLARADGEGQTRVIGQQFAGRVGLFLRVDDFDTSYDRMVAAGVHFVSSPRSEPYGKVAVFLDLEGNRWDLLGPGDRRQLSAHAKQLRIAVVAQTLSLRRRDSSRRSGSLIASGSRRVSTRQTGVSAPRGHSSECEVILARVLYLSHRRRGTA